MSVCLCEGMCVWMLVPKKFKHLDLLLAETMRSCQKPDLHPGNELLLIAWPCPLLYKYFKAFIYQLDARRSEIIYTGENSYSCE